MPRCSVLACLIAVLLPAAMLRAVSPENLKEHQNSLGMRFVALPGTPVLFAVHETRVADWTAYVRASGTEWTYRPHFEQGDNHPVVGVTLQEARAFCGWLTEKERAEGKLNTAQSYRLPTRSEWDAAVGMLRARKPDLTVDEKMADEQGFPWGPAWPPPPGTANYAPSAVPNQDDGFPYTAPVGSFKPNADGLYDLAGNVWEWCWDAEVRAEQTGVLRGGSWAYFRPDHLRSSYLYVVPADLRMPTIGFRCVFEDRQRSAILLAAEEAQREIIRAERREQILGKANVKPEELAAMRQKLTRQETADVPNPEDLKPAEIGKRYQNALGLEFVPLPGQPTRLLGTTEVRVQDYASWINASGRKWENRPEFLTRDSHPAVGVTWDEAVAFAEWQTTQDRAAGRIPSHAHYRLPSDAEWSLAAGLTEPVDEDPATLSKAATDHFPWPDHEKFPPPINSINLDSSRIDGYSDAFAYTAPVQSEAANAVGIHGLGGNAAEWCADVWPGAAEERVIRGGSWLSYHREHLRTGTRQHAPRTSANASIGFRLLLELEPPVSDKANADAGQ